MPTEVRARDLLPGYEYILKGQFEPLFNLGYTTTLQILRSRPHVFLGYRNIPDGVNRKLDFKPVINDRSKFLSVNTIIFPEGLNQLFISPLSFSNVKTVYETHTGQSGEANAGPAGIIGRMSGAHPRRKTRRHRRKAKRSRTYRI